MTVKSDRIGVTAGRKVNLGDYNSLEVVSWFETNVDSKETVEQAYERAWLVVEDQLTKKIEETLSEE